MELNEEYQQKITDIHAFKLLDQEISAIDSVINVLPDDKLETIKTLYASKWITDGTIDKTSIDQKINELYNDIMLLFEKRKDDCIEAINNFKITE